MPLWKYKEATIQISIVFLLSTWLSRELNDKFYVQLQQTSLPPNVSDLSYLHFNSINTIPSKEKKKHYSLGLSVIHFRDGYDRYYKYQCVISQLMN